MAGEHQVRHVADTARWVAMYRALESERRDALFQDPWARHLAGAQGERIYASLPKQMKDAAWSVVTRTVLIDRLVLDLVRQGVTLVVNLAAGLDSRPYRLALPASLRWIEVDDPDLLDEKSASLAGDTPRCALTRIGLDLSDAARRREVLAGLPRPGDRMAVLTEGLIMYLRESDVAGLAEDLRALPACETWITDTISPGLRRMINTSWKALEAANAQMLFAPVEGPAYFEQFGWRAAECQPLFSAARRLKRLPWLYRLFAVLPGVDRYVPERPWSAVLRLTRAPAP